MKKSKFQTREKRTNANSTHQQSQAVREFEASVFLAIFVKSKAFRSSHLALQVCAERYKKREYLLDYKYYFDKTKFLLKLKIQFH